MRKQILEGRELEEVLDLRAMTEPGVPGEKKAAPRPKKAPSVRRSGGR
jgi:hypothetical protein